MPTKKSKKPPIEVNEAGIMNEVPLPLTDEEAAEEIVRRLKTHPPAPAKLRQYVMLHYPPGFIFDK